MEGLFPLYLKNGGGVGGGVVEVVSEYCAYYIHDWCRGFLAAPVDISSLTTSLILPTFWLDALVETLPIAQRCALPSLDVAINWGPPHNLASFALRRTRVSSRNIGTRNSNAQPTVNSIIYTHTFPTETGDPINGRKLVFCNFYVSNVTQVWFEIIFSMHCTSRKTICTTSCARTTCCTSYSQML